MSDITPPPASSSPATPPPPKIKRRRWLKVLLALVVLVILLIVLAPTIISMEFVKNIVVGKVNDQLNGKVSIDSWSIGWTSGVRADGVRVLDATNTKIAEVKSVNAPVSLLAAARGNINLDGTVVDSPWFAASMDADGKINFAKLLKTSPSAPKSDSAPNSPAANKPTAEPAKLPHVTGNPKLINGSGQFTKGNKTVYFTAINGDVAITDLNQPITDNLTVTMKVGANGTPGTLAVKGTASAIKNNAVDINSANLDQTVTLQTIDLAAVSPFIPPSVGVMIKSGMINGQLALNVKDGKSAVASGQIDGTNINIAGPALKGDEYVTKAFQVAIAPINVNMPGGPSDINQTTIKFDKPLTVTWDQVSALVDADLPLAAVMNLADKKAPGAAGKVVVDAKVDVGKLAAMLPHLVDVRDGTTVSSGNFHQTVNVTLAQDAAAFALTTEINDIAGKNNGTDVKLQPINMKLTGNIGPSTTALPGIKDLNLALTSAFANATLSAPTLSQMKGQANGELAKVQSELGQLIDFGQLKMNGSFVANLNSSADPNDLTKPATIDLNAALTNLNITGLPDQASPVTEAWMGATAHATVLGSADGVKAIKDISVTAKTGQQNPSVDFAMTADVPNLVNGLQATYTISNNVIIPQLQKELGPLVAALRTAPDLGLGTLAIDSAGSVTQTIDKADPSNETLNASVDKLSITESTGLLSVKQSTPISVKIAGQTVAAAGTVDVNANLVKFSDVIQKVTAGKTQVTVNGKQPKLNNGNLHGTIALANVDASTMSVKVDMTADGISIDTAQGPTQQQTITFGLATAAAADFSAIKNTSLYLKSPFADVDVKGIAVDLPKAPAGAKGPALPIVQNADWTVDIADVGPLQTLITALTPAADPANPPMTVPRGAIKLTGNVKHEGTATVLNVSEISTKELRLQKGGNIGKVKDVNIALAAKVDITGDTSQTLAEQFKQVSITQLTGHLGVAELTMPQPIVITNPLGAMNAAGQIALTGEISDVTTLLETLAGKQPGELYPLSGRETLTENISTAGNTVTLKGNIDIADFKVMQNGVVVVNEPKVSITNELGADLVAHNAKITAVTVDMPTSGAVKLNITGSLTDWLQKRQIDGVKIQFAGDWEKLWPIAKPFVPPADQAMVADLVITGKFDRTINVTGSYPAGMPMPQAIKLLNADGSVNIAGVTWPSMGVTASNIDVPFMLKDGIARLLYANKPEGQNAAKSMTINNGPVALNGFSIDLTQPDPRLYCTKDFVVADKVALNNVLAAQVGKYLPIFSDASSASGLASVTFNECDKLPLSALLTHAGASNDGTAKITYSVQQLQVGSPVVNTLLSILSKEEAGDSLRGDIKDATITIANGEATQDTTVSFGQNANRNIRFAGGVGMESLKLDNFIVSLSPTLLAQVTTAKGIEKYMPDNIGLPLKGTLPSNIKFDTGNIGKMVADAVKKAAVDNFLGGGKKKDDNANNNNNPAASQPAKQDNPIKDLQDLFGKKKKKK